MDDNFNEKLSLDDLFTTKETNQKNTIKIFQKILARAHKKIKTASRQKFNNDFVFFVVPEFLLGVPKFNTKVSFNTLPLHFGKILIGSHGGNGNPTQDIARYYEFIKRKKINLNKLISKTIKINEINKEINNITDGKSFGRIMIKF